VGLDAHGPVIAGLTEVIRRGRKLGVFDNRQPLRWLLIAVIALGHAAADEVASGRMSARVAGRAYRDSVIRLLGTGASD
jgi:hypothetical protein